MTDAHRSGRLRHLPPSSRFATNRAVTVMMPRTRLVDRNRELAQIETWLASTDTRLVTVSGAGGCGKTRLALEVVRSLGRSGVTVYFVPLADVADPSLIEFTIGRALGITDVVDDELATAISAALSSHRTVLILDNAEHVADAVAELVVRLLATDDLSILVTSRRRLRIDSEVVLSLRPLTVPLPTADLASIGAASSVQLFCERVAAVRGDFALGPDNASQIADICRRLDGLPLALELAASRCADIGPAVLSRKLDRAHGLAYLESAIRAVPVRQRTIESLVRWSYDLLDEPAKRLFRTLGALPGWWTIALAEGLADDPEMVIDAVTSLVDLNLVEPDLEGTELRLTMLDTIRTEALEMLVAEAEFDLVLDRIATHCVAIAESVIADNESPRSRTADAVVSERLTLLDVGFRRLCATDRHQQARGIAVAVAPFLLSRGMAPEALRWLQDSAPVSNADDEIGVDVEVWKSRMMAEIGPGETGPRRVAVWIAELESLRTAAAEFSDPVPWLRATDHLGHALTLAGRLDDAERITDDGLERCTVGEQPEWRTMLLHRATLLAQQRDDRPTAIVRASACADLAKQIGFDQFVARAHQALVVLNEDPSVDPTDALLHNLDLCLAADDTRFAVSALLSLGTTSLLRGKIAEGSGYYLNALSMARSIGWWHSQGFAVMGAASAASLGDRPLDAARLHGALTEALPEIANSMPPDYFGAYSDLQAHARGVVGDATYAAHVVDGGTMTWPQTLTSAAETLQLIQAADAPWAAANSDAAAAEIGCVPERKDPTDLTARERDVLALLVDGHTNDQIATRLGISPKTAMHHSSHIFRKWGVRGRAAAVSYAFRNGYLDDAAVR